MRGMHAGRTVLRVLRWGTRRCVSEVALARAGGAVEISPDDHRCVERYAEKEPRMLTLRQSISLARMQMDIGSVDIPRLQAADNLISLASFVREELLIRLALTLRSFLALPRTVAMHPLIHQVFLKHWENFKGIVSTPMPETAAAEREFAGQISGRMQAHSNMLGLLSKGFREVREDVEATSMSMQQVMLLEKMEEFLEVYVAQRLSRRLLVQHYLSLRDQQGLDDPPAGVFDGECCPSRILQQVAEVVDDICVEEFGIGCGVVCDGDTDATIPYIGSHLWYVAREIMKNAMRATVEHHGGCMAVDVPPIHVTTYAGSGRDANLWVRVSDRGGGMGPAKLRRSWGYGVTDFRQQPREERLKTRGHTTGWADPQPMAGIENSDTDSNRLAGHGFGLPLSRNYLRFFGGDLRVRSADGCGTQVFLQIKPLCLWKEDIELLAPHSAGGALRPPRVPAVTEPLSEHKLFVRRYQQYIAARGGPE